MSGHGVVAVDIGNSTVKLALQLDQQIIDHFISLRKPRWPASCSRWVHEQLACDAVTWRLASVRSAAAKKLCEHLIGSPTDQIHSVTRADLPIDVLVDEPERVGIDRLLAAFAASQLCQPPLIVVDVGSAITVDWVDTAGRFGGGAILPGLTLQADALHRWTESLPNLREQLDRPVRLPGRNTSEAIGSGILVGAAGAIDRLATRYLETEIATRSVTGTMVLTGGHAALIAPLLEQNHRLEPNLVCRGLLQLPRSEESHRPEAPCP